MSRLALIGDIGGHLQQLQEALWSLGVDDRIPDDLIAIQVGDLVHKGPDSDAVVELVDGFLQNQPERWVQLMGNHEACHLGADLFAHDQVSPQTEATLRRWYDDGLLRLGVAVSSDVGPILVTHAGLTHLLWKQIGRPATPAAAVAALDEHRDLAWRPGSMLADTPGTGGVLWAEAGYELYFSWLRAEQHGQPAPFGQVHGHASAWRWGRHRSDAPPEVATRLEADASRRHVRFHAGGQQFVGIDPGFGQHADGRWDPLVLEGHLD